jgi:hypothetical protein
LQRCGRLDDQIELLKHKLNLIHQGLAFNGKRTKTARSQGKKFQVSIEQEATRLLVRVLLLAERQFLNSWAVSETKVACGNTHRMKQGLLAGVSALLVWGLLWCQAMYIAAFRVSSHNSSAVSLSQVACMLASCCAMFGYTIALFAILALEPAKAFSCFLAAPLLQAGTGSRQLVFPLHMV